jgi:uncharacterized RDD family membrane protein YckC
MENPYAPPRAAVHDVADPSATFVAADPGARFGAAILDGLIATGMVYGPFVFVFLTSAALERGGDRTASGLMLLVGLGLALIGFGVWCWLTISHVKRNGQTLGKKMLGIKVVRKDGAPASLGRIFWLRNVINGLIGIIPLYALVDHVFIFGESRQCLHDKIADTIVVVA